MKIFGKRKIDISSLIQSMEENDEARGPLSEADRLILAGLAEHPGFPILLGQLAARRRVLEHQLLFGDQADLRAVDRMQSGIMWLSYVQAIVKRAKTKEIRQSEIEERLIRARANYSVVSKG